MRNVLNMGVLLGIFIIVMIYMQDADAVTVCDSIKWNGTTYHCENGVPLEESKKHNDSKPFNLEGFEFGSPDARKNPVWDNWIPAANRTYEGPTALELKQKHDKITSHGYSRNYWNYDKVMSNETQKALQVFDSAEVQNNEFENSTYFTYHYDIIQRHEDPFLQLKLKYEENRAMRYLR